MNTCLLSLLVSNHFGVLTRVTGLFSRRGYNIASLSVGETSDPEFSRITIETRADGTDVEQIIKQLQKLEDVKEVMRLPGAETIAREMLLIKLKRTKQEHAEILQRLTPFEVRSRYETDDRWILEFTGPTADCDSLIETLGSAIWELCRTGVTAMSASQELCTTPQRKGRLT